MYVYWILYMHYFYVRRRTFRCCSGWNRALETCKLWVCGSCFIWQTPLSRMSFVVDCECFVLNIPNKWLLILFRSSVRNFVSIFEGFRNIFSWYKYILMRAQRSECCVSVKWLNVIRVYTGRTKWYGDCVFSVAAPLHPPHTHTLWNRFPADITNASSREF